MTGSPDKLKVALCQINSVAQVDDNLKTVGQALDKASKSGVQLLQLPENFAQMPKHPSQQYCEAENGEVQQLLASWSKQYNITIIAGSLPVKEATFDKPFARCLVYHQGQLLTHYDKLHLYDVDLPDGQQYRESDFYQAGRLQKNNLKSAIFCLSGVKIGLSICYDLRFPEWYRQLASLQAEIVCVPSAFTYQTGKAHWQILLQARAIENQFYVLAAAQSGQHANKRLTWGHSMVVNPWGEVIAEQQEKVGLLIAELDIKYSRQLRNIFPALEHRRL